MSSISMKSLQNGTKIKRLIPLPTGLSMSITLLEPVIFVNDLLLLPSVLRGCVELAVSRTMQLRDLAIKFRGVNKMGKFSPYSSQECIIDSTWPVLRLRSRTDESCVLQTQESANGQRHWPVLKPGQYAYDFELALDQALPETFNVGGCKLEYKIEVVATVSSLRRQVSQAQGVSVVHFPREVQLQLHEANQIRLSRIWNSNIIYVVELSDRSAPIGGNVPFAVHIGCSNILSIVMQVYLIENIIYPGTHGKQSQLRKKRLLNSKCNDPSMRKLGDKPPSLNLDTESGKAVIAGRVPLLDEPKVELRLHPDVKYKNIKVTHTMLFLIDITIPNTNASDFQQTTFCRLTAEMPFVIRSPHTHNYDLFVPTYTEAPDVQIDYDSLLLPPFSPFKYSSQNPHLRRNEVHGKELDFSSSGVQRTLSSPSRPRPLAYGTPAAAEYVSPPPKYESIFLADCG